MKAQTMHADALSVDTNNPTSRAERDADETLERIERGRPDTLDNAVAEQAGWQIARLASRLNAQARAIAIALERRGGVLRGLVEASLLQHPDPAAGARAR